jgi:small subunit ribosomal protein S29
MSSPLCLRCLRRTLRAIERTDNCSKTQQALFSTTPSRYASAKKVVAKPAQQKGRTLVLAKKQRQVTQRPPAPGERKALRKRIVLSNTNALEVQGLQDLTKEKLGQDGEDAVALDGYRGQVLGFNNDTVDALRASEAFRPTQGWSLFRRPASLVRAETAELARDLERAGKTKEAIRKVVFGEAGSGKSVLLLQAQAMAFLKGWLVLHFPEAQDLTNAHTSYQPLNQPDGLIYIQSHYTAKLLTNFARANQTLLSTLRLSKQHQLPIPIQSNISLYRFADLGARDPELAWPIWQALWSELTTPSQSQGEGLQRPPVLMSMDGVDQAMRMCAYFDRDANPIHAHELALVKQFSGYLSGQTPLPNGGMVIAATCASNHAASPTLDFCLTYNHTVQRNAQLESDGAAHQLPLPEWQPYAVKDERVEAAVKDVRAVKLQGLTKEEAKGVMEYYAQSGLFREAVTDGAVSEKWTLAGSGIIGELEKASVRARF